MNEKCFVCECKEVKVIEGENTRFFECQNCYNKWGKYVFKD